MLCSYSPNLAATGLRRTLALDEHLLRHAEFLADLQRHVIKLISLVDIHHDTVLADLQRFAQGRHLPGRTHAVRRTQEAALNRIIGDVAHTSPPGSGPVDGMVVAEHQHAVLRQFEVQLHDIDAHADHRLDGGNRILRIVAPVSAVRSHHDVFRARDREPRPRIFAACVGDSGAAGFRVRPQSPATMRGWPEYS